MVGLVWSIWGHLYTWIPIWCCFHIWGCLHISGRLHISGHLHISGCLHICVKPILGYARLRLSWVVIELELWQKEKNGKSSGSLTSLVQIFMFKYFQTYSNSNLQHLKTVKIRVTRCCNFSPGGSVSESSMHLTSLIDFWWNSTPYCDAKAFCMIKTDNFRRWHKNEN